MNTVADRKDSLEWAGVYGKNALKLWQKGKHEDAAVVWQMAWGRALHAFGRDDHQTAEAYAKLVAAVVIRAINCGAMTDKRALREMASGHLGHQNGRGEHGQALTLEMAHDYVEAARDWVRKLYAQRPLLMAKIEDYWADGRCVDCGERRAPWPEPRCRVCQAKEAARLKEVERAAVVDPNEPKVRWMGEGEEEDE